MLYNSYREGSSKVKYRRLGLLEVEVSVIGFGGAALSGEGGGC